MNPFPLPKTNQKHRLIHDAKKVKTVFFNMKMEFFQHKNKRFFFLFNLKWVAHRIVVFALSSL
jgi:hypothetical protein